MLSPHKQPQPFLIKTIEDLLEGVIGLITATFTILLTTMFRPYQLLFRHLPIRPVTYFMLCVLLSANFWYPLLNSEVRFMEMIQHYAVEKDFTDLNDLIFDTELLTKTLVSLIPVAILLALFTWLTGKVLRDRAKASRFTKFAIYAAGTSMLIIPLSILMIIIALAYAVSLESTNSNWSFIFVILPTLMGLALLFFVIRSFCVTAWYFVRRFRYRFLRMLLGAFAQVGLVILTVWLVSGFYSGHSDSQIACRIINEGDELEVQDSTVYVDIILTNHSGTDQPVSLSALNLHVKGPHSSGDGYVHLGDIKSAQPVTDTLILRSHQAVLLTLPFFKDDGKGLYRIAGINLNRSTCCDRGSLSMIVRLKVLGEHAETVESPEKQFVVEL
jgi:hypothetical protein